MDKIKECRKFSVSLLKCKGDGKEKGGKLGVAIGRGSGGGGGRKLSPTEAGRSLSITLSKAKLPMFRRVYVRMSRYKITYTC